MDLQTVDDYSRMVPTMAQYTSFEVKSLSSTAILDKKPKNFMEM